MTDRERLIDIIYEGFYISPENDIKGTAQKAADYLISHGVVVQKHGRWVEKPNPWGQDGSHSYDCSVCGKRTCVVGEKLRYCPNCGVKMDQEE